VAEGDGVVARGGSRRRLLLRGIRAARGDVLVGLLDIGDVAEEVIGSRFELERERCFWR
jgi:hypothetical protein